MFYFYRYCVLNCALQDNGALAITYLFQVRTAGMIEMCDTLDLEILRILHKNARTPFSEIAKTLGVSPSIVQIRFNKMKRAGIILGTTLLLDREKLGVKYIITLGVKALEPEVSGVIKYMNSLATKESTLVAWPTTGRFNIVAKMMSRDLLEAHKVRHLMKKNPYVTEVRVSVITSSMTNNFEALMIEKELEKGS